MASATNATQVIDLLSEKARLAARTLIAASAQERSEALIKIAEEIEKSVIEILAANKEDMERAKSEGMQESLQDRLLLSEPRVHAIADRWP